MSVIIVMVLAGAIAGYDQRDKVSIAHYKLCMEIVWLRINILKHADYIAQSMLVRC